jgi:hypothetical protein
MKRLPYKNTISTVEGFQKFKSLSTARNAAKKLAKG